MALMLLVECMRRMERTRQGLRKMMKGQRKGLRKMMKGQKR